MTEPLTPAYEAAIREHVDGMSNYTLGNLFARDLLAELDRVRAEMRCDHADVDTVASRGAAAVTAMGADLRAAHKSAKALAAAVESVVRDYDSDDWRSTKDQVNELRYALRDYKAAKDGCPEHGRDCQADDHFEPPTVDGEVI